MEKVFLCFSKENSLYARIIRYLINGSVNHAFFIFWSEDWQHYLAMETDWRGTVLVPAKDLVQSMDKVRYFQCLNKNLVEGLLKNFYIVGRKYAWSSIFGFLLKIIYQNTFKRIIPNPIRSKNRVFCSELAVDVLQKSDVDFSKDLDSESTSPEDLLDLVLKDIGWIEELDNFLG